MRKIVIQINANNLHNMNGEVLSENTFYVMLLGISLNFLSNQIFPSIAITTSLNDINNNNISGILRNSLVVREIMDVVINNRISMPRDTVSITDIKNTIIQNLKTRFGDNNVTEVIF